jgi:O-antigen/teichoic acid export membrane protein
MGAPVLRARTIWRSSLGGSLSRVAANAVANVVAFGAIAVLNLLVVPFLLSAYGLDGYGLIVLARLFLPTNVLAVFDFGLPEAVTRQVAKARATGEAALLRPVLGRVLGYVAVIGAALTILFGLAAAAVAGFFAGADALALASFHTALLWTAGSLVLMFPGVIFESIIKGTERYVVLRISEVIAAAAYLGGVIVLVRHGAGFEYVVLLYLCTLIGRYAFCAAYAWRRCGEVAPSYARAPDPALLAELKRYGITVLGGKLLAIAFAHGGSLLIAKLVGAAGVGIYDALTRIPRFLKNAFNMMNGVILPASSRLDALGATSAMQRMLRLGTSMSASASFPVILGAGFYADAILAHWLGPQYANLAGWFALLLVWSALSTMIGVGSSMLLARRDALVRTYRLFAVQVVIHFAVSLALVGWLEQYAFIAGTVCAAGLTFPFVVRIMCIEYGFSQRRYYAVFARLALAATPSLGWLLVSLRLDLAATLDGLVFSFAVWLALYAATVYALVWTAEERAWVWSNVAAFRATLSR